MSLHVYANDATDWFVAESVEEAMVLYRQWLKDSGCTMDESEITPFGQCPDEKIIQIKGDEHALPVSYPASKWAQINGKGFLCTENF